MEPNWFEILLDAYKKVDPSSAFLRTHELKKRHRRSMGQRLRQLRRREKKVDEKVAMLIARQNYPMDCERREQKKFLRAGSSQVSHLNWKAAWLDVSRLLETDAEVQAVAEEVFARAARDTKTVPWELGYGSRLVSRGNEGVDFAFEKLGLDGDKWLEERAALGDMTPWTTALELALGYYRHMSKADRYNFELWQINGHCHTMAPFILIVLQKLFPDDTWEILTGRPGGRTKGGHSLVANTDRTRVADFVFRSPAQLPNHYARELSKHNGFGEFLLLLAGAKVKEGQRPPETVAARESRDPLHLAYLQNAIMEARLGFRLW
jgi:hypothetical protein